MDRDGRASRPYVTSFTKTYHYPEYTKLKSVTVTEDRGDLGGWEGTKVDLVLEVNQPVSSGVIELDLTGPGASELKLTPNEDGTKLRATHTLRNPRNLPGGRRNLHRNRLGQQTLASLRNRSAIG